MNENVIKIYVTQTFSNNRVFVQRFDVSTLFLLRFYRRVKKFAMFRSGPERQIRDKSFKLLDKRGKYDSTKTALVKSICEYKNLAKANERTKLNSMKIPIKHF